MTYLLLDTSTAICRLTVVTDNGTWHEHDWESGRTLAMGLLQFINNTLSKHKLALDLLDGIGVLQGPGSYTGLRIGLTVANTVASSTSVPVIGETGDSWRQLAIDRLSRGDDDQLVVPIYGADAHITKPRK